MSVDPESTRVIADWTGCCFETSTFVLDMAGTWHCNEKHRPFELPSRVIPPKRTRYDGCGVSGDNMSDTVEPREAKHLTGVLETLLDELDALNLIQTAARVSSAMDTLREEIARNYPADLPNTQQIELARAVERD